MAIAAGGALGVFAGSVMFAVATLRYLPSPGLFRSCGFDSNAVAVFVSPSGVVALSVTVPPVYALSNSVNVPSFCVMATLAPVCDAVSGWPPASTPDTSAFGTPS